MYDYLNPIHVKANDVISGMQKKTIKGVIEVVDMHSAGALSNAERVALQDVFLFEYMHKMHHHARAKINEDRAFIRDNAALVAECYAKIDAEMMYFKQFGFDITKKYLKCFVDRCSTDLDKIILLDRLCRYYNA